MNLSANKSLLGNVISTWKYKPPKSNKFLFTAIAVLGGLLITAFYYFEHLIPFLKRIPGYLIYLLIFLISPFLKYITGKSKDQMWTIYENGYSVVYETQAGSGEEVIGYWRDFATCTYDSSGVKLIPHSMLRRAVKIPTIGNVTEVYAIARERISMANAQRLEKAVRAPERPNTREQRQLQRAERKAHQKHQREINIWNDLIAPPVDSSGEGH